MSRVRPTFSERLYQEILRSPFWLASLVVNFLLFHAITLLLVPSEFVPVPAAFFRVDVDDELHTVLALEDESPPFLLEEGVAPELERVFPEDPVIKDAKVADHNETDNDLPYEESLGARDFISDGPVGIGGGAGGSFGGRGGHRNLRAEGGGGGAGGRISRGSGAKSPPVKTWQRSSLVPNTSKLSIGDKTDAPLRAMNIAVRIDGYRARVLVDCFYENPSHSVLEGRFMIRMPDGASPYFFAFGETAASSRLPVARIQARDVDFSPEEILASRRSDGDTLRAARMVAKEKAVKAYKRTTRRRIDPALVEWGGAGVFRARVFPLQPGRTHRIVIGYEVNLLVAGDELVYQLDLPKGVPEMSLAIDAADEPEVTPAAPSIAMGSRSLFVFEDPKEREIALRFPCPKTTLLTGTDQETGRYFSAMLRPALPKAPVGARDRAVFLVDLSDSSNPDRLNIWLRLLEEILTRNRDSMREFAVLFFHVDRYWWRKGFVANDEAAVEEVLAFARKQALEGATNLSSALEEADAPAWHSDRSEHDVFLLSDGAITWGEEHLPEVDCGAVFAYRTGLAGTDVKTLSKLARDSGGGVFSVVGDSEVAAAAVAHRNRPWRLAGVRVSDSEEVLVAGRPETVYPGQVLHIAGLGTPMPDAEILVMLECEGEHLALIARPERTIETILAIRTYGEIATALLEETGAFAEEETIAHAAHFRVVGRSCSLLMLESERDYQANGIVADESARTVRARPAGRLLAELDQNRARQRGDPRTRFLAEITRISRRGGIGFKVPVDILARLSRNPIEEFRIRPKPASDRKLTELSTLVEKSPGKHSVAREVAFRAMAMNRPAAAYHLLSRVAKARPDEPESWRALALCLERCGRADMAVVFHEIALQGDWDGRFRSIKQIARMDYASLLAKIGAGEVTSSLSRFAAKRLEAIGQTGLPARGSLVVIIGWNTDGTDVDLHVTDPRGVSCNYEHTSTEIGGQFTGDVTQGFGPEMFFLPKPVAGRYKVQVRYFSADGLRTSTKTTVYARIIENYGTPSEKVTRKAIELEEEKEFLTVATIKVPSSRGPIGSPHPRDPGDTALSRSGGAKAGSR